jgi:hypothetical protein
VQAWAPACAACNVLRHAHALRGARLAMTPEQHKEEISKAYLYAVAARCAFKVGTWTQDSGGLDTHHVS